MSADEYVTKYNERVLEIANESFNLGKFDMKVTTIEEVHDITNQNLMNCLGLFLRLRWLYQTEKIRKVKTLHLHQYMKKSQLIINHQVKQM